MARARYSDSVEEQETVGCFLADQVIGLEPRYTRRPEVDLRSFGSPTQSALEKTDKDKGPGVKAIP